MRPGKLRRHRDHPSRLSGYGRFFRRAVSGPNTSGASSFADPAWDMLLELYAARLERRQVTVSSLYTAASVPAATAHRWIRVLEERKLIKRKADPKDGRRSFLELRGNTAASMAKVLRAALPLSGPIL